MTNFNLKHSTVRPRAGLALAALGATVLIAGCGSSGSSSTITVGNENTADNVLIKAAAPPAALSSAEEKLAAAIKTPTSGPLSKEPTVTPPAGAAPTTLVVKDLIVGTGKEAKPGETLVVNYVGVLYKGGKEFDASWKRHEPFAFALGKGKVIAGWDQGLVGMKVGGRRELIIPSPLAYGPKGSPPSIPPNSALVFVIDLISA